MARLAPLGACLILIALGAILAWGLEPRIEGLYLNIIGLSLIAVGVVGLPVTFIATTFLSGRDRPDRDKEADTTVVER